MALLVIGLGNPGKEYENTRHNVGFRAVSRLSSKLRAENAEGFSDWHEDRRSHSLISDGRVSHKKLVLMMPQTFMNESGIAVQAAASFRKIENKDILVVYDDKDLEPGTIRIRKEGSAGGHNGMGSIIEKLGTNKIARMRVGIGAPKRADMSAADFVLGKFSPAEERELGKTLDRAVEAIMSCMLEGIEIAMNRYNASAE